jgi:DNA-binding NtrC family response regulator
LSERAQVRLLEAFDDARAPSDAPRWIATSRAPLAEAAARGELRLDLCERLRRLQLELPPLSRRRGDVPALIASFAQRFAADEGLPAPSLSDDAIALLWRQPWPGNLRQLESFVYKIVLLHAGREATGEQLEQLAARFQFDFVARVPSRAPDAETVRAALETTANQRGSVNKTRAALYLGWDPDTLTSRMSDLGLSAGASSSESAPPPVS